MHTFVSDDGKIIIHVSGDFSGTAEIMVGDRPPFEFDPSVLSAIGEHYLDFCLNEALAQAEGMLPGLEGDARQEAVEELTENIKQLVAMRDRSKPAENAVVVRCAGCGAAYDGPLMSGFICAECSCVWDPATSKWSHQSGIDPAEIHAMALKSRGKVIPAEIVEMLENKRLLCPEDVETATTHYDPGGPGCGEEPTGVPRCAGCGCAKAEHKTKEEPEVK